MRKIIVLTFLCTFWGFGSLTCSASPKVDSLVSLAWEYRVSAPDSGMLFARQALKLAQQESYPKGIGDAYSKLGTLYEAIAEYDSAIVYHQKSFDERMALGDSLAAWGSYKNIGNSYYRLGKLEVSLTYFYGGLQGYDQAGDLDEILPEKAKAYNNIGLAYMSLAIEKPGLSDSAFHYFNLALDLSSDLLPPPISPTSSPISAPSTASLSNMILP